MNWVRRSRKDGEFVDYYDAPLVEIYSDNTYGVLKRTFSALTSPTGSYTAAQQTTDFGSTQSTVYAIVYQVSDVVGRGFPLKAAF
jgi:hypothetical protein